jgi:hypothetical protein
LKTFPLSLLFAVPISTVNFLFDVFAKVRCTADKGTDRVLNLRYEFWQKIREGCFKDLIFINESAVNLAIVRLYSQSLKGSIAKSPKPNKGGKNVSIIGAISVNEVLTSVNLIGTIDAITFEAFIIQKLVQNLWKGACVVMDNCTIYSGE